MMQTKINYLEIILINILRRNHRVSLVSFKELCNVNKADPKVKYGFKLTVKFLS